MVFKQLGSCTSYSLVFLSSVCTSYLCVSEHTLHILLWNELEYACIRLVTAVEKMECLKMVSGGCVVLPALVSGRGVDSVP